MVTGESSARPRDTSGYAEALIQLTHTVNHMFSDASREHGLTPQQAQLLGTLTEGPMGMTELSTTLHLERSSLSGLVDRVERRGYVVRVRDDSDRRAYRAALTGPGNQLAHSVRAAVVARLHAHFGDLSESARRTLVDTAAARDKRGD